VLLLLLPVSAGQRSLYNTEETMLLLR